MLGGLFLSAKPNNLRIVNAYNAQGFLAGDLRINALPSVVSANLDINISKSFFKIDTFSSLRTYPSFHIFHFIGVGGGGGGGGTGGYNNAVQTGENGSPGLPISFHGKIVPGRVYLTYGSAGVNHASRPTGGGNGGGQVDPAFFLYSGDRKDFGGAGGQAWAGGGEFPVINTTSWLSPIGDGGAGAAGFGPGNASTGGFGKLDIHGMVW